MEFHHNLRGFSRAVFSAVVFLLILTSSLQAPAGVVTEQRTTVAGNSLISEDAVILTLRLQDGIFLDTTLALEIDRVLDAVWSEYDTLIIIHTCAEYLTKELLLSSNAS